MVIAPDLVGEVENIVVSHCSAENWGLEPLEQIPGSKSYRCERHVSSSFSNKVFMSWREGRKGGKNGSGCRRNWKSEEEIF